MKIKKNFTLGLVIFAVLFLFTTAYYFFYQSKFINLAGVHDKGNFRLGEIFSRYNYKGKYNTISFKTLSQILWYGSKPLTDDNISILFISKNIKTLSDGIYIYNKKSNILKKIKNTTNEKNSKIIISLNNTDKKNYFTAGRITENIILGLIDNNINFNIELNNQKILPEYNIIAVINIGYIKK